MHKALSLLFAVTFATPVVGQSDVERFPVFGPSEERAAFFAEQAEARQEAYQAIQTERAAALKAAAAEEARKPDRRFRPYNRYGGGLTRELICTDPSPLPRAHARSSGAPSGSKGVTMRVRPAPQEQVCRVVYTRVPHYPEVYYPRSHPRAGTQVIVGIGKDGVRGRLIHRQPGLTLDIIKD